MVGSLKKFKYYMHLKKLVINTCHAMQCCSILLVKAMNEYRQC